MKQHVEIRPRLFPIAMDLLAKRHEQLLRDHYDDNVLSHCDGCAEASAIRIELELLAEQYQEV